mmetsp:Transcript_82611/g.165090  ORF Transcript_82611/g.165090 Transcript_82611/m.165090 type:complete len:442 (-) Transcript_82611:134-1459(-)
MINTYSSALDRTAWCPKLDFHLLQDLTLIVSLVNLVVITLIYINISAFPIFAIGEENKERGYNLSTWELWRKQELEEYDFMFTLFDVVLLNFVKYVVIMSVWSTGPYTSNASTVSWVADIPEYLVLIIIVFLFFKVVLFDYQKYVPDTDPRGESNAGEAESVKDWQAQDGEVVAAHDWSHENAKNSSIALLVIAITLSCVEYVAQKDANRRERKYKRYLVHPDRCPICTQPVGSCSHQQQFGLDVIRNWHYDFCGCFGSMGTTLKLCLCCCCCCYEGDVAAAYNEGNCCMWGLWYCISCWFCCPCGIHAFLGCQSRMAIRKTNQITGTPVRDFFSHWCCCCCALIQEKRQLHADRFVKNEFTVRATDDELAKAQLQVTAAPKITFGMFQGDIVAHRRRDGVLEYRVHWESKPRSEDDWFIRNQLMEEFPDVVVEYERLNGI